MNNPQNPQPIVTFPGKLIMHHRPGDQSLKGPGDDVEMTDDKGNVIKIEPRHEDIPDKVPEGTSWNGPDGKPLLVTKVPNPEPVTEVKTTPLMVGITNEVLKETLKTPTPLAQEIERQRTEKQKPRK